MHSHDARLFETVDQLEMWLERNHGTERELWVRIFKKESGAPTVTWNDCVVAAIAWGWIDEQRKSLDAVSFLQRLTPRRARSSWSKKNREHGRSTGSTSAPPLRRNRSQGPEGLAGGARQAVQGQLRGDLCARREAAGRTLEMSAAANS